MPQNTLLNKQFRNIIKILGVAIAVYLALTVKIGLTGETDEVIQFDYIEQEIEGEIESQIEPASENEQQDEATTTFDESKDHGVSSVFNKLCSNYKNICNKISRSGEFTDQDKTVNFAYVIFLLNKLDTNITRGKDPSKALIAMIINEKTGSRRGSANRNTITINLGGINYDNEFFQIISHEMGHIIDLGGLQGTSKKKSSTFTEFDKTVFAIDDPSLEYYKYSRSSEKIRKNGMSREDFCSGYGMTDPFEDFAECHNLYLNHHDYFHKLALNNPTVRNKYNFMSNLYGGKYINDSEAKYENRSNSYRVWDTTKIREG